MLILQRISSYRMIFPFFLNKFFEPLFFVVFIKGSNITNVNELQKEQKIKETKNRLR